MWNERTFDRTRLLYIHTLYSFGASVWRVRLALESPSCCSLATIGDGDGGGDHHHPTWVTIRLQRRMEQRTAVSCKKERTWLGCATTSAHFSTSRISMFFSVRVIAAPNGPFKKGVLLDFGFYRTFKKLISIVLYLYTFTECKEKEEPLHIL